MKYLKFGRSMPHRTGVEVRLFETNGYLRSALAAESGKVRKDRGNLASRSRDRFIKAALRRRVQIALKPASKGLGLHRIFKRGEGRKYVIADSTFKRVQIDAWACWLDAGEHHLSLAVRTGGAPKRNEWDSGRWALRLVHDASLE